MSNAKTVTEMSRQIDAIVEKLALDLRGLQVLTEAATGAYVVTPVIAARAGAQVTAFTGASPHGTVDQVRRETALLAGELNVMGSIRVTESLSDQRIAACDIVTNCAHLRPLDEDLIGKLKPGAVIPLMYEAWEFRGSDVDLDACRRRRVVVAGTNERHPDVAVFDDLGPLVLHAAREHGHRIEAERCLVVCDNDFRTYLASALTAARAEVELCGAPDQIEPGSWDVVVIATTPPACGGRRLKIDGIKASLYCQLWGDLAQGTAAGVWCPESPPPPGHMGLTLDRLGPAPIIRLQAAGLKCAELMRRDPSPDTRDFVQWVVRSADDERAAVHEQRRISIVIPLYNEADGIPALRSELAGWNTQRRSFEIIVVDDGSTDATWAALRRWVDEDSTVSAVRLDRNHGPHRASRAGLRFCHGDCAIVIPADGQEGVDLVEQCLDRWERAGVPAVMTVPRHGRHRERWLDSFFSSFFYVLLRWNTPHYKGVSAQAMVRLMDRGTYLAFLGDHAALALRTPFVLKGKFAYDVVPYEVKPRRVGRSKWRFRRKVALMRDVLVASDAWIVRPGPVAGVVVFVYAILRGAASVTNGTLLTPTSTLWLIGGAMLLFAALCLRVEVWWRQRKSDTGVEIAERHGSDADPGVASVPAKHHEDRP